MTEINCFGYVYDKVGILTPEQFVTPKTATELLHDFESVEYLEAAHAIAYIYLASSEYQPKQRRFMAEHIVWIEDNRKTVSHRPNTGLEVVYFETSLLEKTFPDYYNSNEYHVQYLARRQGRYFKAGDLG